MAWLVGDDFDALFDSYEYTAFRLEVRDSYLGVVYEPEPYRKFLAGEPDDGLWLKPWCDGVRARATAGKTMARVRVVSRPMGDYARYSVDVACRLNIPAGEEIRYLTRSDAKDLPDDDYWLFDSRRLYVLHYDETDDLVGAELIDNPATVVQYNYWRDMALHLATPAPVFPID